MAQCFRLPHRFTLVFRRRCTTLDRDDIGHRLGHSGWTCLQGSSNQPDQGIEIRAVDACFESEKLITLDVLEVIKVSRAILPGDILAAHAHKGPGETRAASFSRFIGNQ